MFPAEDGGKHPLFHQALTAAILDLVASRRRRDPATFSYAGLDLSHAFEVGMYFSCVHDAALERLFHNPSEMAAAASLGGLDAMLLARHRFAHGRALAIVNVRLALYRLARRIKRGIFPRPSAIDQKQMSHGDAAILFLARSLRFAQYFRPFAERLGRHCAFLAPADQPELLTAILGWGFPCRTYGASAVLEGPLGRSLGDAGKYLAMRAQSYRTSLAGSSARLIVVPEGNSPDDEIVHRVAHIQGRKTACVQQGWSPIQHPGFRNMSYDRMLVWGDGFAELLASTNPAQQFIAVGNHNLAERTDATTRVGVLFFLQGFSDWLGERSATQALLLLAEQAAAAMPHIPVYMRPHPAVPLPSTVAARLARFRNIRIESPSQITLAQALAKVPVSVSIYSTTILESIAAGVVPLVFNTTALARYWPDVAAAGAGLEIRDPDEARQALVALLTDPAAPARFQGT